MLIKKLFIDASQAKLANLYRSVRVKVHTCIADIYFNKQCLRSQITPNYARIKINNNSIAARKTKEEAEILYIENTIKELYCTKEDLTLQSYDYHMKFEKVYGNVAWNLLYTLVEDEIHELMEKKYEKLNLKIERLKNKNRLNETFEDQETPHEFQKRVINLTNLQFTEEENNVLGYGLKHNFTINRKKKKDILATDIEACSRLVKDIDQNVVREEVSRNIPIITSKEEPKRKKDLEECLNIKKKLDENDSLAIKADKSNAVVIMKKEDYIQKTELFIQENKFKELKNDPTEKYRKELNETVKKCTRVIPEELRRKIYVPNPTAPIMKGIPKIHKQNIPIRPLVNFQPAPAYNISKILANILTHDLELESKHNVKNCFDFVEKMRDVAVSNTSKFVSFDISNLYTNVPVAETLNLVKCSLLEKGIDKTYVNQLVKLLRLVLGQNYFRFNNKFYLQTDGLAMGSPLSAILSEVFLQHNEELILEKLKRDHNIVTYTRYVDDIFIMYNQVMQNEIEPMLKIFNTHHKKLLFTYECEDSCKLNFLDLIVIRNEGKIEYDIYRKPTQTNTAINKESIHPQSHKTAAFRSMLFRAYKIPLSNIIRKKEIEIIKSIARANGYESSIVDDIGKKVQQKIRHQERKQNITTLNMEEDKPKQRYVSFHFTGKETQKIANRFKKFDMSVAFKTNNTMDCILNSKIENCNKYHRSGIYQIECNDCNMFYIGQTVNFNQRYKNHISAWKNNRPERSNIAKHLLENKHSIGNIENCLDILHSCKKGNSMNAWEELYIYKEKCKNRNKLINEQVNFDSCITFNNVYHPLPVGPAYISRARLDTLVRF